MVFRNLSVDVKVTFRGSQGVQLAAHKRFKNLDISIDSQLGTYDEPFPHPGTTILELTVEFSANDQLSFPVTPPPSLTRALASSLDGQVLIDTKFYLYSARVGGQVGQPRPVYGNTDALVETSAYFKNLLSGSQFQSGVLCDIYEDPPEVLGKLSPKSYDYESDSDLEDIPELEEKDLWPPVAELDIQPKNPVGLTTTDVLHQTSLVVGPSDSFEPLEALATPEAPTTPKSWCETPDRKLRVHAYAISGSAHRTWKAYVYYVYSNEIQFRPLKSRNQAVWLKMPSTACSPKSMYRFADYAGLPDLRSLAKDKIREGLSEGNIIHELFSRFSSKYDEIIEMEVAFLLDHFTSHVSSDFDTTLEKIVQGSKTHCYRTLAFTIKRLHGEDVTTARKAFGSKNALEPGERTQRPTTKRKSKRAL